MNVTVENLAPCRKLIRVELEAQAVDATFETVTSEFQREAKLPGFRPGKAPRPMVIKTYSKQLEEEVRRRLIGEHYKKALAEQKLHAVSSPEIEEIQFGRGKALQFAATVETAPEFELPEYKGLPLKRETGAVPEADLEKALNILREQHVKYNDVSRPARDGDIVVVSYTGTSDGQPLTEIAPTARGLTHQENFWIQMKPGTFIAGFQEQLAGAQAGEKRTINITFPADFVSAPLSGKNAVYEVDIKQVKETVLPALDDAFALTYKAESLEKLREGVRSDLQAELDHKRVVSVRNQAMRALMEKVTFDLPEGVLSNETRSVIYDIVQDSQRRGLTKEDIERQKNDIFGYAANSAKDRVKGAFLLGKIADKEDIKVTQEDLLNRINQLATQNQIPFEKMLKELRDREALNQISEQILVAKALDFVVKNAAIEEVPAGTAAPAPAEPPATAS